MGSPDGKKRNPSAAVAALSPAIQCYTELAPIGYLTSRSAPRQGGSLIRSSSNRRPERAFGEGYRLLGLGMQFAGGIILFVLGGYVLDSWLGTMPAFTVVGTLLGAGLSFLNVYLKLQAINGDKGNGRGKGSGT